MPFYGEEKRAYENRHRKEKRDNLNEIGPIPECSNIRLRDELEANPSEWLRRILPDIFFSDFTDSQKKFIELAWDAIENGSWRNVEAYRGIGKTSILSGLLFKALCQGTVRHALYVTAEGGASVDQASTWFQSALYDDYQSPTRLFSDLYPEISYPLQKREGKAQRPLTVDGVPLRIELKSDKIVLPSVPNARCCGSLLRFTSISSGGIRGANHTIPGVGSFRVRAVMLDDIQNDATAKSVVEVDAIISTIQKSIRGLAGRKADGSRESLTVLSAITQNQPGDVAERIIEELPEFGTIIIPFVKRLPDNFEAWKQYREFRTIALRKYEIESARVAIANYYKEHQQDLVGKVEVDDPRLFEAWQVDAKHYAVDYWAASESSFWCEFQNDARRAASESAGGLTAVEVARKTRKNSRGVPLRRCWIPAEADILVAHIDAGEHYLNYEVCAYSKDFTTAHVVDFGVFPEQPGGTASKKKYAVDLQDVYERGDKFDRLRDATLDLLIRIFEQQYYNDLGEPVEVDDATQFEQHAHARGRASRRFAKLAVCGVDCSDGEMELAIWSAIDDFHRIDSGRFYGKAIPAYGVECSARLLRYYDLKPGEWRRQKKTGAGFDWIENAHGRKNVARGFANVYASFTYDSNTAKTRRDASWKLPADREGSATIFSDSDTHDEIEMFAQHQTAEEYTSTKKSGLEYRRWRMKKPRVSDNEFLDTDAGCRALAEYVGCSEFFDEKGVRYAVAKNETAERKRVRRGVKVANRRT